jgi:RNA polymerase sigma-70 factor (ECF subfamily)
MQDELAARFEADRAHLRAVAFRMLGSGSEADDAVQEAWLRLSRSDTSDVDNLTGWLTTVVARVSLTMLQSRSRRPAPIDVVPDAVAAGGGPEEEAVLADSVGLALLVVLDTLAPAERLAFVLHDLFAVSFEEIAPIVGRSPAAARQLASRARRRVRGAPEPADQTRGQEVVRAFLAASRGGDFEALVALLDPDAVVLADAVAVRMGSAAEVVGAAGVAATFLGRAKAARLAMVDGVPGAVWAPGGRPKAVIRFTIDGDLITGLEMVADPEELARLDIAAVD